jgi:hypothetical protein
VACQSLGNKQCVCMYSYQPEGWLDPHTVYFQFVQFHNKAGLAVRRPATTIVV